MTEYKIHYYKPKPKTMDNLSWLQELVARWKAESPTFFKVISTISFICVFVTGIPMLLTQFGVNVPEVISPTLQQIILVAGLVGGVISKLTVATPNATERILEKVDSGVKPKAAKLGE